MIGTHTQNSGEKVLTPKILAFPIVFFSPLKKGEYDRDKALALSMFRPF